MLCYDYLSPLLSIYIDLELLCWSKNQNKSIKKNICSNLFYILGKLYILIFSIH